MKTLLRGKNWVLWVSRYEMWIELCCQWDYHNYTASITILTFEIGFEWVWRKKRDLKKNGFSWGWFKA